MKVLMLAPGQSVHAQRPLNLLLQSGCDVTFIDFVNPLPEGAKHYHFIPYPLPRGKRWFSLLGRKIAEHISLWVVVLQLYFYWKRVNPDITHIHWISPQRVDQCLKAGIHPLVLSAWGSDINNYFLPDVNIRQRKFMKQILEKVDFVVVDANEVADRCSELAQTTVLTRLLPLGVNTKLFKPGYQEAARSWRKHLDIPDNAIVLLSIRAWGEVYGHHIILEAFAQAYKSFDGFVILLFKTLNKEAYADAESYELQIRSRVEELGLSRHIRWLRQVPFEQLPEIYSMTDVIVNYPSMDAFPVTFQEAAACERMVISVRLPAYADTFAERFFSMIDPGDVSQLAEAIVRFVNSSEQNKDHQRQLLSQARREVEKSYDEQVYVKELLGIYQTLAGQ